ncbi:MAG: hypothetical protein ACT6S0_26120 [Roseateles sp.]
MRRALQRVALAGCALPQAAPPDARGNVETRARFVDGQVSPDLALDPCR